MAQSWVMCLIALLSYMYLLDLSLSKFSLSRAYDNCSRPVDFKLPLLQGTLEVIWGVID